MKNAFSAGVVHELPPDMQKALLSSTEMRALWESLTPLARNEWICWVISVKQAATRKEHVQRMIENLQKGKRRPCCWIGCIHRTDKKSVPPFAVYWKNGRRNRDAMLLFPDFFKKTLTSVVSVFFILQKLLLRFCACGLLLLCGVLQNRLHA